MSAISGASRAVLLALLLPLACQAAESAFWGNDLEAARKTAARTNRYILIHFSAPWCQPCQQLEREVFSQPGFGRELQNDFVAVKLDYDSFPATRKKYGVQSIPTDVILSPQGQLVERIQSPRTAQDYVGTMSRVVALARRQSGTAVGQNSLPAGVAPGGVGTPNGVAAPNTVVGSAPAAPIAAAGPALVGPALNGPVLAGPTMPIEGTPSAQAAMPAGPALGGVAPLAPAQIATAPAMAAMPPPQPATAAPAPPEIAPLGLDGFCPVSILERREWRPGKKQYGMQHRGRTYLFAGPQEQAAFAADPDRYSPVLSGMDPVLWINHGQSTPGSRMYGYTCDGRIYLFSSEQSVQEFVRNVARYAPAALEARNSGGPAKY